jgi:outer membrane protein assembly factor BamB
MLRTLSLLWVAAQLGAADWPRFHGPNGAGVSTDAAALPLELGPGRNVVWKAAVPRGASSPVVAGGRVWLSGHDGPERLVVCFDRATGRELWRRSLKAPRSERRSAPNDPASPTPVTDGTNVYVLFPDVGLLGFDSSGGELWKARLGPFNPPHGMAASPILANGNVIVVADQIRGSFIAAFDAATGEPVWRHSRADFVGGYATPVLFEPRPGTAQVVVCGPVQISSYSAATGENLWSMTPIGAMPIASPALVGDVLYVNVGSVPSFGELAITMAADKNKDGKLTPDEFPDPAFKEAVLALDRQFGNHDGAIDQEEWDRVLLLEQSQAALTALRLTPDGAPPAATVLWRVTKGLPDVPSPIVYGGIVYLVRDGGIFSSLDAATGKILKEGRLPGALGRYFASPVAADGKVVTLSESGALAVVRAGAEWEVLAVHDLGEECWATPALAGGRLYVRTAATLYCFGARS